MIAPDLRIGGFLLFRTIYCNLDLFSLGEATALERDHSEVAGMESLIKDQVIAIINLYKEKLLWEIED